MSLFYLIVRAIWIRFHKGVSQSVRPTFSFPLNTNNELTKVLGETEPQWAAVIRQPALAVWPNQNVRRWTITLDGLNVNGRPVVLKTTVKGAPANKAIALLDTGASLVYGPKADVDGIYSQITGSTYYAPEKIWIVPCLSTVKVEFVFA